jgi:hypothetical protein
MDIPKDSAISRQAGPTHRWYMLNMLANMYTWKRLSALRPEVDRASDADWATPLLSGVPEPPRAAATASAKTEHAEADGEQREKRMKGASTETERKSVLQSAIRSWFPVTENGEKPAAAVKPEPSEATTRKAEHPKNAAPRKGKRVSWLVNSFPSSYRDLNAVAPNSW